MKKLYDILCLFVLIFAVIITVMFSKEAALLTTEAVSISFKTVIPSIFPFIVISQLLSRTGIIMTAGNFFSVIISPLFGIPKELCGAFLTGITGGFPNGAYAAALVYSQGYCTKAQAERAIAISNNCSLSFLTGIAGINALGSIKNGIILIISQLISILILSLILRFHKKADFLDAQNYAPYNSFKINELPQALIKSISESISISLTICGFIVTFYLFSELILSIIPLGAVSNALIKGLFEISAGVTSVKSIRFPLNFIICSAIVGFSGLSVIFQVTEVSEKYGLSAKEFFLGRIINAVLLPIITAILLMLIPAKSVSVFNTVTYGAHDSYISRITDVVLYAFVFAIVMIISALLHTVFQTVSRKHHSNKRMIE